MSTSVYSSEQLLKWLFTTAAMGTRPTAWYVALHTGDPSADGSTNELTDANYARQSVGFTAAQGTTLWEVTNDADVVFPAAGAAYTAGHVTVWDSQTGGNMLARMELPLARSISPGGVFTVPAGELVIKGEGS